MKKTTLVITLMLCLYAALNTFSSYYNPALVADPIITVGHGAVIGANGKEVKLTPKFIETVQQFYLTKLLSSIEQKGTKNYLTTDQIAETQKTIRSEVTDNILATALLIDWLLEKTEPNEGSGVTAKVVKQY